MNVMPSWVIRSDGQYEGKRRTVRQYGASANYSLFTVARVKGEL